MSARFFVESSSAGPSPSRHSLLQELSIHGINVEHLESVSLDALSELLVGVKEITFKYRQNASQKIPDSNAKLEAGFQLSHIDKELVKRLLASSGSVSSLSLSRDMEIPLTTLQRRKKKLELTLIKARYALDVEKLGWHTATIFCSIHGSDLPSTGEAILDVSKKIKAIHRIIGSTGMDFAVEVLYRNVTDIAAIIEKIKALPQVENVAWTAPINKVVSNDECTLSILDEVGSAQREIC